MSELFNATTSWRPVTTTFLCNIDIIKVYKFLEVFSSSTLWKKVKHVRSTTGWLSIGWWPYLVQIPQYSYFMKLIANHRQKTELKTFRLHYIIITVKTAVPHIFKKANPPFCTAPPKYTPPCFNTLIGNWLALQKTFIASHCFPFPSRLKKRCRAAMYVLSVPQSARIILGVPPICLTQSTKYCATIEGLLLDAPTSNHIIRRLYPSMAPCTQKPKGFNLSNPSICHRWFGPFVLYCLGFFYVLIVQLPHQDLIFLTVLSPFPYQLQARSLLQAFESSACIR